MTGIDEATIARLRETIADCERLERSEPKRRDLLLPDSLKKLGRLARTALPALLEERAADKRHIQDMNAWAGCDGPNSAALQALRRMAERSQDRAAENARLRSELDAARRALEPFARFADAWDQQPLRGLTDQLYTIHGGTEYEASLRLSDCVAARRRPFAARREGRMRDERTARNRMAATVLRWQAAS